MEKLRSRVKAGLSFGGTAGIPAGKIALAGVWTQFDPMPSRRHTAHHGQYAGRILDGQQDEWPAPQHLVEAGRDG